MSGIYFGDHFISYQDIKKSDFSIVVSPFQTAFEFCKNYLTGVAEFPILTSGSTGPPKTVVLSRGQLQSSASMTIRTLGLRTAYKTLLCISTDHIGGKMMLVRGMELGMEIYLTEPKAELLVTGLPQVDFMALVPVQLHQFINSGEGRNYLNACKVIIVGGAGMDPALEKELDQLETPIYHTFGMTETASHFALKRLNGTQKQQNYLAFEGVSLSKDTRGCLIVEGEITNNIPLITNDLIDLIDQNEFKWLGRWDRVINTGGYKVHPELLDSPIRNILSSLNIHQDYLLVGLPHARWGQQVTLVLEMEPLNKESETRLQELLKSTLHSYEVPKEFRYLNPFPRTGTGKADLQELYKILNAG